MLAETAHRTVACLGLLAALSIPACAGSAREGEFRRLVITGEEIESAGYDSAYEALTHHRQLIIFEDRIGFRGGADSAFGREAQRFFVPLLVVDGNWNLNDEITTLRRIPTASIVTIRLYRASMVPPEYRRPGAEGGVIEVTTRAR